MTSTIIGLAAYLGISFSLAWGSWHVVSRSGLTPKDSTRFQLAILPGACAPAAAAFLVRWLVTKQGFSAVEFTPRISTAWPYYLAGLLTPVVIALISYGLARATGATRHADEVRSIRSRLRFLVTLPLVAVVTAPFQFGEEFGWRAFFQTDLFPTWPLLAAVVTGLIWALWHAPLFRMGYTYPSEKAKGFVAFTVHAILLSVFLGWIYVRTGDIWAVCLAHMANNAIGCSSLEALLPGKVKRHVIGYEGLLSAIPLGAICLAIVFSGGLYG
jgi:membrane protease YdiL (CAAX protease family)